MEFEEQPIHQMITEIKGSDRTLEEESMDTTTLIFVIIGAFTVSSWFMRLVNYLDGGKYDG